MDIALLGMDIDSRPVKLANNELDYFARAGREADRTAGKVETSTAKMGVAYKGAAAKVAMVTAAMAALGGTINQIANYERQISKVAAVSRATAGEINAMRKVASQLGSTTEFTGKQAAEGLEFLARAGFSAADAIEAIPAVLDLATAAAMDLGTASDISSNIMSAFGIAASDAAQAADVLAAASSRSNTDVLQLGDAMKYVGPVADAMGVSMNDAAAAIGVLSDAGIQGSMAGTSLRRILSSLANTTPDATATLQAMGVAMEDVEPTTNSLVDIVDTLSRSGLNAAQALTIFGDRGGPAILALTKNSPRLAELTAIMQDVEGESAAMANTMRDNLGGDIDGLKSSVQGLIQALGDAGLTFVLRETIQLITGITRGITSLITIVDEAVTLLITYSEAEEQRKAAIEASNEVVQIQSAKMDSVETFMKEATVVTRDAAMAQLDLAEATIVAMEAEVARQEQVIRTSPAFLQTIENEKNIRAEMKQVLEDIDTLHRLGQPVGDELGVYEAYKVALEDELETRRFILQTMNGASAELFEQQEIVAVLRAAIEAATGNTVSFRDVVSESAVESVYLANGLSDAAGQASALSTFLKDLPSDLQGVRENIAGLKAGLGVLASSGDEGAAAIAQYRAELLASVGPLDAMQDGQRAFVTEQIDLKVALFEEEQRLREEWSDQVSALNELDRAGEATSDTLIEMTTQAQGFAYAIEQAGVGAAEFGQQHANVLIGGIDGVSSAWGDFVSRGFTDFQGFVNQILGSFQSMIAQMITMATRNRIMLSLGFSGVPGASFAGMAGNSAFGNFLPGLFGNGGAIQGIATGLGGVLSGGGLGSSFANLGGLLGGGGGWGAFGAAIPAIGLLTAGLSLLIPRTQELDAGLRITANGMSNVIETFREIEQTRLFGLIRNQWTEYSAASAGIADPITAAITQIQLASIDAASAIGLSADAFDGFSAQFSVSTQGLTDDEALAAVTAEMENLADAFAETALAGEGVIRMGEGASDTLSALALSLSGANDALDRLGLRPYEISIAGADAARNLVEAFGGLDAFTQSMSAYLGTFYSEAEQLEAATATLNGVFADLGMTVVPQTHAQFRMLVESLREMGDDAGFAALIQVAPLFDEIATSIEDNLVGSVDDAASALAAAEDAANLAYLNGIQTIEAHRDDVIASWNGMLADMTASIETAAKNADNAFGYASIIFDARNANLKSAFDATAEIYDGLIDNARGNVRSLTSVLSILQSGVSTRLGQSSTDARAAALALIRSGDVSDVSALRNSVSVLNADSKSLFSSRADWQMDFAKTTVAMQELQAATSSQLSTEEQTLAVLEEELAQERSAYEAQVEFNNDQLAALESQLDALNGIDTTLQGAIEAIYGANADASAVVAGAVFDHTTVTDYVKAAILELATLKDEEALLQDNATAQIAAAQASADEQIAALQDSVAGILQLDTSMNNVLTATGNLDTALASLASAQYAMTTAEQRYADAMIAQADRQSDLLTQILLRSEEADRARQITELQDELYNAVEQLGDMPELLTIVDRQYRGLFSSYITLSDGQQFYSNVGSPEWEIHLATQQAMPYINARQAEYDQWMNTRNALVEPLRQQIRDLGGVPAFDAGGYHAGGRARIGENDIELVAPSRIYSGEETREMLDNRQLVDEVKRLNAIIEEMREEQRQFGLRSSVDGYKVRKILEKFNDDGLPPERVTT